VQETVPGKMPYLGSLCLVSSLLAGVYTAKIGRIRLAAILPIVICILVDLSNMTRALMILDGIIFSVGYFVTRSDERVKSSSVREHKVRRIVLVVALLGMLVGGAELARSTRHANEDIVGASRTLQNLQFSSLITPSVYMYMTAHHGVLNQYLKHDGEHGIWGGNTLAPMYRGLDKLGFQTYVNQYQTFYKTPVGANTGTYLRELHADFGIPGVLIVPYIIGFLTSFFWYRYADTSRYIYLALLGYFMVVTGMSVFYLATRLGYLLVYLLGSVVAAFLLDMSKSAQTLSNTVNVSPA
jgi:oligosaccharide repeat unit polymerase